MVVVTFSGVPMLGGMVVCGRTGWILVVTKTSLTREATKLDFPTDSSPQTQILTEADLVSYVSWTQDKSRRSLAVIPADIVGDWTTAAVEPS